jgi:uncharacterized protein
MYARKLEQLITELLGEFRIVYVTGPRQAGKTTVVRHIATEMGLEYITLDDQATLAAARFDPHGFIAALGDKPVVLDEFQYAPELVLAIKEASDALSPLQRGKFLLTGSTDIFRSAQAQEALPGHMARLELYPLSIAEITGQPRNIIDDILNESYPSRPLPLNRESLANAIVHGGYPEIQNKSARARQMWFKSYIEGRLLKDFSSLYAARGDYHSKVKALVSCLAGLSGNLLKYANIANDLELNDQVAKRYIEILELMFIVKRVPAYLNNRSKRQIVRMPKVHFVDPGLACALLGLRSSPQLLESQHYGGLLESFLFMEFTKQATWADEIVELYHFRDNRKHEVDIVLERSNHQIVGLEIKASRTIHHRDFIGLRALAAFAGKRFEKGILLYTGDKILPFKEAGLDFCALPIGLLFQPGSKPAGEIISA